MIALLVGCSNSNDTSPSERTNDQSEIERVTEMPTEVPATTLNNKEIISLNDGPIFIKGDNNSFNLTMYSLNDHKTYPIFSFNNNSNKYKLAIDLKDNGNFFHEQLFDSRIEKLAISWYESSDSSNHVGWIDKSGAITDITNIVHPAEVGFTGKAPQDSKAFFTSDDQLVFYDQNQKLYCYFDPQSKTIVDTYDGSDDAYFNDLLNYIHGLNPQNKPTSTKIKCADSYYSIEDVAAEHVTRGFARDYVEYSDGFAFLDISNNMNGNTIFHFGPTITEIYTYKNDEPYYTSTFGDLVNVTPETEYQIENLAYSNETIVFTATKGTERALFKIPYRDRKAGEPEKIADIDKSLGDIFFWKDNAITINTKDTQKSENNNSKAKEYIVLPSFSIIGKWKNVGEYTFGQSQKGSIISFDGTNCNFFSPKDTYAFYKNGDNYKLDCTSPLADTVSFTVKIVDENNIDIFNGTDIIELKRVN